MDPQWIVGIVVTVALTVIGWVVARLISAKQVISTQRETIDTLRRQLDRMEITAELTNKIMLHLPLQKSSGSTE
jgi:uncharacterized membrane-anchored protein YhcB (DUF1043 family)